VTVPQNVESRPDAGDVRAAIETNDSRPFPIATHLLANVLSGERIARELHGHRSGTGWMACCPAHNDRSPSLSISEGEGGKLLVKCFAGCKQEAVIDALRSCGLWPHDPSQLWPRAGGPSTAQSGRIVAAYDYRDESGRLLFQVVRIEPGKRGKKKDFVQRRPDGVGGWIWKTGVRQVLYRLSEVLEAAIVFIVEGEKDVETLRSWGFVATCNPGGAGKWRNEYSETLAGKSVVVVPDRDEPGWAHARQVVEGIRPYAAGVVVIDLEDAKDVSDWFQRHSEVELLSLLDSVWQRKEAALNGEAR